MTEETPIAKLARMFVRRRDNPACATCGTALDASETSRYCSDKCWEQHQSRISI